jgi:hypothetical protein
VQSGLLRVPGNRGLALVALIATLLAGGCSGSARAQTPPLLPQPTPDRTMDAVIRGLVTVVLPTASSIRIGGTAVPATAPNVGTVGIPLSTSTALVGATAAPPRLEPTVRPATATSVPATAIPPTATERPAATATATVARPTATQVPPTPPPSSTPVRVPPTAALPSGTAPVQPIAATPVSRT